MRKLKHLIVILLVFGILTASIPGYAYADCDYSSLGKRYCEASHPHAYYRTCKLCGEKIYDGTYGSKNHGDGSWGSGTCPQCGDHEYTGQSCTTGGTCVCGATAPALGHNLYGVTASETAHPHYYYKDCSRCGEHVYTGGHGERPHGDGTGVTCKDCGEHSLYLPDATAWPSDWHYACGLWVKPMSYSLCDHDCFCLWIRSTSSYGTYIENAVNIWNGYIQQLIRTSSISTAVHIYDVEILSNPDTGAP